jgi:hypothetical protein
MAARTPPNVVQSVELTPNIRLLSSRRQEDRSREADRQTDAPASSMPRPYEHAQHGIPLRAERQPHADLVGALGDGVGHQAGDADRGERQRDHAQDWSS